MIVDTISVSYSSMQELLERQEIIENTIADYIEDKELADSYESQIRISDDRYYLTVNIIKD